MKTILVLLLIGLIEAQLGFNSVFTPNSPWPAIDNVPNIAKLDNNFVDTEKSEEREERGLIDNDEDEEAVDGYEEGVEEEEPYDENAPKHRGASVQFFHAEPVHGSVALLANDTKVKKVLRLVRREGNQLTPAKLPKNPTTNPPVVRPSLPVSQQPRPLQPQYYQPIQQPAQPQYYYQPQQPYYQPQYQAYQPYYQQTQALASF
ncbi:unnamed protein product, partial [Mesorhabditis belari]|uniref:Uncharacterized protein n=1 Tax=Mesorhabditis belari TaxID=2138241 RepID=A0AAF3EPM9_9BILA